VCFAQVKTFAAVRDLFSFCKPHIEPTVDLQASIEYCKKDGAVTERGKRPASSVEKGVMEKKRWELILLNAKAGRFDEIPAQVQFQHARVIDYIYNRDSSASTPKDTTQQMLWLWGDSGSGKSRSAREKYPDAYLKMCNKWWDGYHGQPVVIIEDFDAVHNVLCHHLKIWGDRYPFNAELKGSARKIRPDLLIVTSNYHPSQIWFTGAELDPILRRYKTIEFKAGCDWKAIAEFPYTPPAPMATVHETLSDGSQAEVGEPEEGEEEEL